MGKGGASEMDYAQNLTWVENLRIQSYSEHPEVNAAADVLVSEFYKGKKQKRNHKAYTRDARKLVASLWLHEQELFRFTTKKAYFESGKQGQRKQVWMTRRSLDLFNTAVGIGWVVLHRKGIPPGVSKTGKGFNSVYRTTQRFYNLLTHLKHEDVLPDPDAPRIELKDENGILQSLPESYTYSEDYSWTVNVLEKHYQRIQDTNILSASGTPIPLHHLFYVRKFKGSLTAGGRLYAHIENYPKQDRLKMTMDGRPVCSLDISQLHPQLMLRFLHKRDAEDLGLFAQARGDDIYTMIDYPELDRSIHKKLINLLFNAKTPDSGCQALMSTHHWRNEETGKWECETYDSNQKRKGDPVLGKASMQSARAYLYSFKRHHPLMSPAICSGMGVRLQAADGRMMLTVLDYHNNVGLPVIPIHDEIIVPRTQPTMEFAVIALRDAFRNTFGEEGRFGSIYAKWSFGDDTKEKGIEIKLDD